MNKQASAIMYGTGSAFFLSVIASVPRLIRTETHDMYEIGAGFIFLFLMNLSYWAVCRWFIYTRIFSLWYLRAALAIIGCALISVLLQKGVELLAGNSLGLFFGQTSIDNLSEPRKWMLMLFRGGAIGGFMYFLNYHQYINRERQKTFMENEKLKRENLAARLHELTQQVSPHFLFNSLNTLKSMAENEATRKFIQELANVYRYTLGNKSNIVSLKNELGFVNSYLYILHQRFEQAFQVNINIPDDMLGLLIPPYALQTVIENCIKHNKMTPEKPLIIDIFSHDSVSVTVRNNLQPKSPGFEGTGIGLQNIRERCIILTQKEINIYKNNESFAVQIPLLHK